MGAKVDALLTDRPVSGRFAAAMRNPAWFSLRSLYREVLKMDLPPCDDVVRARRFARLRMMLTRCEISVVTFERAQLFSFPCLRIPLPR